MKKNYSCFLNLQSTLELLYEFAQIQKIINYEIVESIISTSKTLETFLSSDLIDNSLISTIESVQYLIKFLVSPEYYTQSNDFFVVIQNNISYISSLIENIDTSINIEECSINLPKTCNLNFNYTRDPIVITKSSENHIKISFDMVIKLIGLLVSILSLISSCLPNHQTSSITIIQQTYSSKAIFLMPEQIEIIEELKDNKINSNFYLINGQDNYQKLYLIFPTVFSDFQSTDLQPIEYTKTNSANP